MARERCYLLLDADITAYWFAFIGQESIKWDENTTSVFQTKPLPDVLREVDAKVAEYKAFLEADEVIVCLSCSTADGWRFKLLPTYKAGRGEKPLMLADIKQHLRTRYRTYEKPTMEADDILGILSTHPKLLPGRRIILSTDKDMRTIPGWLYNPNKMTEPELISEAYANRFHMTQTLTGDSTDNYKGCPGIGPKKAEALLDYQLAGTPPDKQLSYMWAGVLRAFEAKGLDPEDALLQARVARIARHTDYDFKRKEIKLWNPPTIDRACSASTSPSKPLPAVAESTPARSPSSEPASSASPSPAQRTTGSAKRTPA